MEFGGIYLDRDVYVVQSLDVFRKYQMTLNWGQNQSFETSLMTANRNARFLKLWLDSYHDYKPEKWYYNAGELPTERFLLKQPDLVNRVMVREFQEHIKDTNGLQVYRMYKTIHK